MTASRIGRVARLDSIRLSLNFAVGKPVVVIGKLKNVPTVKVALATLVMIGGWGDKWGQAHILGKLRRVTLLKHPVLPSICDCPLNKLMKYDYGDERLTKRGNDAFQARLDKTLLVFAVSDQ